jgi:L-iditol 2-dehydrogenase
LANDAEMRAAVYRGVNDVRVERLPIPELGAREALVRIASCGVCGTDIKKIQYGLTPPPRIFGHEMAGTIAAVGAEVTGWSVGDRVVVMHHVPCMECYYCAQRAFAQCPTYKKTGTTAGFEPAGGGFAEYIRVMDWIVERGMVRVPETVSLEEATFVEPVNTCLKAIYRADVRAGQSVAVFGQGQIGLLFTQLAHWRGAEVYAVDPLEYRRETAMRMGATAAFAPERSNFVNEARSRTQGRGADLAIVAVASNAVAAQAFEAVRPGGKVLLFAQTRLGDPLQVDAGSVCMLEKDLIGSYSSDITLQDQSAELVFSRALNVRDLITHRFPLEEIGEALALAISPRDHSLKIMVQL